MATIDNQRAMAASPRPPNPLDPKKRFPQLPGIVPSGTSSAPPPLPAPLPPSAPTGGVPVLPRPPGGPVDPGFERGPLPPPALPGGRYQNGFPTASVPPRSPGGPVDPGFERGPLPDTTPFDPTGGGKYPGGFPSLPKPDLSFPGGGQVPRTPSLPKPTGPTPDDWRSISPMPLSTPPQGTGLVAEPGGVSAPGPILPGPVPTGPQPSPWTPPATGPVIPPNVSPPTSPNPFGDNGVWTGQQWVDRNHPLAQPILNPAAGGGGTSPGQTAPGAPTNPTAPGSPATPGFDQTVRDAILKRLGQSENPSLDDPIIQGQLNARRTSNQRAEERLRGELAEQNAAEGQERGAINPAMLAAGQRRGEDEADFSANLMAQQQQKRAEDIRQALQVGAGILNQDEQRKLQKELADLELKLKNRGLDIQEQLGGRELDIRKMLGEGGLSLGFLQTLLGRTNFLDQLGFDYGAFQHDANRRSILDLL